MKLVQKGFAVAAMTIGAGVLAAGPAVAAPYWQSFSTNSNWSCGDTQRVPNTSVFTQVCIVKNDTGTYRQAVVIVNNQQGRQVQIEGGVGSNFGSSGWCNRSDLNPGLKTACFGNTVKASSGSAWSTVGVGL
ncbi:hypothetical protein [Streptomyces sp. NPDC091649]|uniref:hypothetical protein n=1 Tax=Streptomyces sp. NPDC091649 TaxID=3366004 RepID=UPI0037FC2E72